MQTAARLLCCELAIRAFADRGPFPAFPFTTKSVVFYTFEDSLGMSMSGHTGLLLAMMKCMI